MEGAFVRSPLADDALTPGLLTGGALWGDYDNDGWSDLYVLAPGPNRLLRNAQGQALEDATAVAGVGDAGKGSSAAWGDYDNDGWLDLYVAN